MRIIRDYECLCGHAFEGFALSDTPVESDRRYCGMCDRDNTARAVLSPTQTTFAYADTSARKHRQ